MSIQHDIEKLVSEGQLRKAVELLQHATKDDAAQRQLAIIISGQVAETEAPVAEMMMGPDAFRARRMQISHSLLKAAQNLTPFAAMVAPTSVIAAPSVASPAPTAPVAPAAPTSSGPPGGVSAEIFADLKADYAAGQVMAFVGAGLSTGLPSWSDLTTSLRDALVTRGTSPDVIAEVDDLLSKKQFIDALSAVKLALGALEFNIAIEKSVDDAGKPVPEGTAALATLSPKLRAVLTANLDRFLERAFSAEWETFTEPTGDLAQKTRFILKLHGTRSKRDSWVFTRDQYDRATFGWPRQKTFFQTVYHAHKLLFVGYGLVDDDFDQLVAEVRALAGANAPMHYALMKKTVPQFRRRKLEDAGIRILEYRDHADVPAILRALAAP